MPSPQQIPYFISKLPRPVLDTIKNLQSAGVHFILVGGSVRDWLHQNETKPLDLDFEIRHTLAIEKIESLLRKCHPQKIEFLPFHIVRLKLKDVSIEMTPPRREFFAKKPWFKHSEFRADIDPQLPPDEAWKRRDFTINAIGIDMKEETLVDPYNGLMDLTKQTLRPCGPTFSHDPVRFLRLIRFQCQYEFALHPDTKSQVNRFNLQGLTPSYFFKESFKSPFSPFVSRFFDTVQKYSIPLPEELSELTFLSHINLVAPQNVEEVLLALIHKQTPPTLSQLQHFSRYAGISDSFLKQQRNLRKNLEQLAIVDEGFFQHNLKNLSLQDFLGLGEVSLLTKVHQSCLRNAAPDSLFEKIGQSNPNLLPTLALVKKLLPGEDLSEEVFPSELPPEQRGAYRIYLRLKQLTHL